MQTGCESVEFGSLSIEVPAACPDTSVFKAVIAEELQSAFGQDSERAAFCKFEYDRCQEVPAPFSANWQAATHYQAAQMALSPAARRWQDFEQSVANRFSDYCLDDGRGQAAAIQGWRGEALQSSLREKPHAEALIKLAEREQYEGRTWRLDQMKVADQSRSGSWRDRRSPVKAPQSQDKSKGRSR